MFVYVTYIHTGRKITFHRLHGRIWLHFNLFLHSKVAFLSIQIPLYSGTSCSCWNLSLPLNQYLFFYLGVTLWEHLTVRAQSLWTGPIKLLRNSVMAGEWCNLWRSKILTGGWKCRRRLYNVVKERKKRHNTSVCVRALHDVLQAAGKIDLKIKGKIFSWGRLGDITLRDCCCSASSTGKVFSAHHQALQRGVDTLGEQSSTWGYESPEVYLCTASILFSD